LFDVAFDFLEFRSIPNPMVKTLILPEVFPRLAQKQIRMSRRWALDRFGYKPHWDFWLDKEMNVIRHHHPGVYMTQTVSYDPLDFGNNQRSDSRLFQP